MCEKCAEYNAHGGIMIIATDEFDVTFNSRNKGTQTVTGTFDVDLVLDLGCLRADVDYDDVIVSSAMVDIKYCPFCGEHLKEFEDD
jgi:hypothetical protein